jgi:hypothetical protein
MKRAVAFGMCILSAVYMKPMFRSTCLHRTMYLYLPSYKECRHDYASIDRFMCELSIGNQL